VSLELRAEGPFRLGAVVRSHGWFQTPPFAWDEPAGLLSRVELLSGGPAAVRVTPAPGGAVVAAGRELSAGETEELRRRAARMLQLRADLAGFEEALRVDPALAADLTAYGAGRVLAGASLYEDVVKAVCATTPTWTQAVAAMGRIAALDRSGAGAGGALVDPEAMLALGEDRLRAEGRVGYRAPFLLAIARAGADGALAALDAEAPGLEGAELEARLRALPGVGPATASYLCLLMGRYDRPGVDSATIRIAAARWFGGRKPSRAEVLAKVAPAGRFAGLVLYWATVRSWQRETGLEDQPA
jgi:N-glycosylase/DNA lyase